MKCKKEGKNYNHNDHFYLPEMVMQEIKQTFRDLSDPALLEKCLRGRSQNPNESLNNVIWTIIPKRTFVGLITLHFGVSEAVLRFNEGHFFKTFSYGRDEIRSRHIHDRSSKKVKTRSGCEKARKLLRIWRKR